MKVLILDLTHGGQVLSKKYLEKGDDVTVVDVYHNSSPYVVEELKGIGVKVPSDVPEEEFDLLVMPVHCPDSLIGGATYRERIWFSQAVNSFMEDDRFRIEITGVKGKTSTCYILAHILSIAGEKVYLQTSRGSGPYVNGEHDIWDHVSIAPPYLLTLPHCDCDVIITEVSLGGSGKADIAGITNLLEDYGIAMKSRKAEEGKKDVLCQNVNIVRKTEIPVWEKYGKPLLGYGGRIFTLKKPVLGEPLKVYVNYRGPTKTVYLDPGYLSTQYLEDMDMAIEICNAMGIEEEHVLKGLETFRGVPGRGQISVRNGVRYIVDRNPGISHLSVEKTLGCLSDMGSFDDAVMIIDPVSKKVCDKLDRELIKEVADRYGVEMIVTSGNGEEPAIPEGKKTVIRMIKEGYQ